MISTQQAKAGGDDNDHILCDQHADHHSDSDAKQHQSQKSSHIRPPFLEVILLYVERTFTNTESPLVRLRGMIPLSYSAVSLSEEVSFPKPEEKRSTKSGTISRTFVSPS